MDLIRTVIVEQIPNTTLESKKHALSIVLPDDGFDFDAVPAFNQEEGSGWIQIANTHATGDEDAWKASNTYQLIETVSGRNIHCGGRFVHQVRMAKQVIETAGLSKDLPGLHVETFAYFAITESWTILRQLPPHWKVVRTDRSSLHRPHWQGPDLGSSRARGAIMTTQSALDTLAASAARALQLAADGDETGAAQFGRTCSARTSQVPTDAQEKALLTSLYAGRRLSPKTSRRHRLGHGDHEPGELCCGPLKAPALLQWLMDSGAISCLDMEVCDPYRRHHYRSIAEFRRPRAPRLSPRTRQNFRSF